MANEIQKRQDEIQVKIETLTAAQERYKAEIAPKLEAQLQTIREEVIYSITEKLIDQIKSRTPESELTQEFLDLLDLMVIIQPNAKYDKMLSADNRSSKAFDVRIPDSKGNYYDVVSLSLTYYLADKETDYRSAFGDFRDEDYYEAFDYDQKASTPYYFIKIGSPIKFQMYPNIRDDESQYKDLDSYLEFVQLSRKVWSAIVGYFEEDYIKTLKDDKYLGSDIVNELRECPVKIDAALSKLNATIDNYKKTFAKIPKLEREKKDIVNNVILNAVYQAGGMGFIIGHTEDKEPRREVRMNFKPSQNYYDKDNITDIVIAKETDKTILLNYYRLPISNTHNPESWDAARWKKEHEGQKTDPSHPSPRLVDSYRKSHEEIKPILIDFYKKYLDKGEILYPIIEGFEIPEDDKGRWRNLDVGDWEYENY